MGEVRLRFAPSPTGYLHLGGARTALYNWLWARSQGGKFVVRVEDTDQERSTAESTRVVLESMHWLGLDWDEGPEYRADDGRTLGGGDCGPYYQMERLGIYAQYAERLIRAGQAYRCYATKEEIAAEREAHQASGSKAGFRFESPWRDKHGEPDRPHVVRMKAPREGKTGWLDRVRGRIDVPNETLQDVILLRSDGVPLYNFGVVVDDLTMGITLVARGDDHIVNTPIQILLYEALGEAAPEYAHLSMILGPDGQKLSKRHAAVGVLDYREHGYLPDGVVNYLARLGWSHGDQEIFTRGELIEKFSWDHVGKTGARYDAKKFLHVQGQHLRMLPNADIAMHSKPFLEGKGVQVDANDVRLVDAIEHVKTRACTLDEIANDVEYFFKEITEYEAKGRRKFLTPERAPYLEKLSQLVDGVASFEAGALEAAVLAWLEADGLAMKDVAQPARVALTGRTRSPGLYDVMVLLGKDEVLKRLKDGADVARTPVEDAVSGADAGAPGA